VGSVMVQSQSRIQVQARLQIMDQNGYLLAETNIGPGPQFRIGHFYAEKPEDAAIGLALNNPSADKTVTCTIEVVAEDATVLGITTVTLGPHSQIARFLFELFSQLLTDEGIYKVYVTCPDMVCALALYFHGFEMFEIPVFVVDPN